MGKSETHKTSEWPTNDPIYETTITHSNGHVDKGLGRTSEDSQRIASEKSDSGGSSGSSGGSSSSGSSGGSSSGSCYLTTACVNTMGLPDNCLELNVLRNFRDKVLMLTPTGKKAVREYYGMAPEIVSAVNVRTDARRIWHGVYRDIRQAVALVLDGDFEEAFKHYQQMTFKLKGKYLA